jgi:DNA polymerase (family 10)
LDWIRHQPGVERAEAAGSLRRWKTTVGDSDIVVAIKEPSELMKALASHPDVQRVWEPVIKKPVWNYPAE